MTIQINKECDSRNIYNFSKGELIDYFKNNNEPSFRSNQLWHGLYNSLASNENEITSLPQKLRQQLSKDFRFNSLEEEESIISSDQNTIKYLFKLADGLAIETVLMKYSDERHTICISTQVGCAMGCGFCATGQMGFKRDLSIGEIVEQIIIIERKLRQQNAKLTNIVVMGMGEPFANYNNTISAMNRVNDKDGFNFGARRITISTVGLIPQIQQFAQEKHQFNLAISLHAANNELRSKIVPINRKYPLEDLIQTCKYYIEQTNRRITFEWALIKDINDNRESAIELSNLIKGLLSHVNLIVLNPIKNSNLKPPSNSSAILFKSILEERHIPCSVRIPRGIDIHAGCGQLFSNRIN